MWDGRPYEGEEGSCGGSVRQFLRCCESLVLPTTRSRALSEFWSWLGKWDVSYSAGHVKQNIGSGFQGMSDSDGDDRNIESEGWKVGLGWL